MATAAITMVDTHRPIPLEKGSPIVGCLPAMAKDPLAFFKGLAEKHPDVVEFRFPNIDMALVTDTNLAQQILIKQTDKFRKSDRDMSIMGVLLGNGLVTNNSQKSHKIQRKLIQPGFHFRRIQDYADTMIDYTDRYLSDWKPEQSRDISDDMFKLTMFIVSKTLFNTNMEDMAQGSDQIGKAIHVFQNITNKRFNQLFQWPEWIPTPNNIKAKKARTVLHQKIDSMLESRKQVDGSVSDAGDLMSMLLNAKYEDGTKMSTQQIMDELLTLFVAGHETTSNALTWTFYLLAKHPEIQQKLFLELDNVLTGNTPTFEDLENLSYTEMVVKEAMRILPSVWTLNCRQANEDTVVGDYLFPKNKVLFISPYANHHNPRFFPNPEVFDPERFTPEREKLLPRFAYIPFGAGPRVCIGNSFAMMEAKLILATIVKRFEFSLCEGQELALQPQITLSNKGGMKLNFKQRF